MAYSVESVDLTLGISAASAPLIKDGRAVNMVKVQRLTRGATFSLVIGRGAMPIPNTREGDGWKVCPSISTGIFGVAPPQPGCKLDIVVSYDD